MKLSTQRILIGAVCLAIGVLCGIWGHQLLEKTREKTVESASAPAASQPVLSAEEAFDKAVEFHHGRYPELDGYNILDNRTVPDGEWYDVEFTCNGWKFAYEVDGQNGYVRAGEAGYDPSAAQTPPATAPSDGPETSDGTPASDKPPAEPENRPVGEQAALEAALAHAGVEEADLVYQYVELEYDGGRPTYYEVEFGAGNTAYGYEIGPYDCAVRAWEYEEDRVLDAHHPELFHDHHTQAADIGADAALKTALTHAGYTEKEAWMQRAEPDWDSGALVYEVSFRADGVEYEYKVDAASGEILEFEQEKY